MSNYTNEIKIANVKIGNGNPIAIQSMTNTKTKDIVSTINQIYKLTEAGADIVRVSVPDIESANAIKEIKRNIFIPLVADIHFDYKLAIESIKNGADKIRFNPGNIGDETKVKYLVDFLHETNTPVRIGVNQGSLEKNLKSTTISDKLCESCMKHVKLLEKYNYTNIVLSIKSSNTNTTIKANKKLSKLSNYPIHLGVTEAGVYEDSIIKSSIAIGSLLLDDIGDTIRVSITGDPVQEIKAAQSILKSINMFEKPYISIVSCPTCARCEIDLESIVRLVKSKLPDPSKNIKIAIMGCIVNGPGEARGADIALIGGKDKSTLIYNNVRELVDNNNIQEKLTQVIKELDNE